MTKGIDVSSWQGIIDFEKVRQDGITFCIAKAGGLGFWLLYRQKIL